MTEVNPLKIIRELREQISSEKRKLGFFIGAGASISAGLSGMSLLTEEVYKKLPEEFKDTFIRFKEKASNNIEQILNRVSLYRELIGENEDLEYEGIKGKTELLKFEFHLYSAIFDLMGNEESLILDSHYIFCKWLRVLHLNRNWPVEIFTPNYDVLIEKALEDSQVPYFDGFIGSLSPFFLPEAIRAKSNEVSINEYPPKSWTRLWKIHGSINWRIIYDNDTNTRRIIRVPNKNLEMGDEMMIYPSLEKYEQSRKLPFICLQDQLRDFLSHDECLFIIIGYSFSDQHLNEILFQGLRSNSRLTIISLIYGEKGEELDQLKLPEKFIQFGKQYRNHTILGPDKGIIGGKVVEWEINKNGEENNNGSFWDANTGILRLGDFKYFCNLIEKIIGIDFKTEK
jgi:hypothetical protein